MILSSRACLGFWFSPGTIVAALIGAKDIPERTVERYPVTLAVNAR
jgi:hypothetical protein